MSMYRYVFAVAVLALAGSYVTYAQSSSMTFFITSAGPGNGANLGGLAGPTPIARSSPRPPAPEAVRGERI